MSRKPGSGKLRRVAPHTFEIDRPKPEIVRCDGCDNGLERGWTYCAYCGRKIEAEDAA